MKAKKYSEEQIIGALQEVDRGSKVDDVCRRLGISKVTFYRRNATFSGMQVSGDDHEKARAGDQGERGVTRDLEGSGNWPGSPNGSRVVAAGG